MTLLLIGGVTLIAWGFHTPGWPGIVMCFAGGLLLTIYSGIRD